MMVFKNSNPLLKLFPLGFAWILKLCGMLPFSEYFQPDWKLTMYSTFLLSICLLVKVTTISVVNFSDKLNVEEVDIDRAFIISRLVKIIYPIVKSFIPFVAVCNAFWKWRFMHNFCSYLCKNDGLVERKELSLLMKKQTVATRLVILCLFVSLMAKVCSVLSIMYLQELSDWRVLLWLILLYLVDTVGFITEMQFVLMSIALWTRFLQVNNKLESLFYEQDNKAEVRIQNFADEWGNETCNKDRFESLHSIELTNTYMRIPVYLLSCESDDYTKENPVFYYYAKEFLKFKNKGVESKVLDFVKCLKLLRLRHRYLCVALHQVNGMFEHVLLVSISILFLMILLNIYSAIFGLGRDLVLTHLSDTCFWLFSSLMRLVCPLVVTDTLVDQARRTVVLLSNFASRDLPKALLNELQEFSREVDSRKLTVTCAFNLFTINTELLTAAVTAGTTYIVTLIQLH